VAVATAMCAAALSLATTGAQAAGPTAAEREAICADAESRYKEMFGKGTRDEPVKIVTMYKDVFCPIEITVTQGETVRWVNLDKRTSHSVWFRDAGKEESARLFNAETVEMKFDFPPGDYPYLCGPHWESAGMIGKVTVKGK
jgi:plastocyanin